MCTVTYIPSNSGFFLTSNRDEHIDRGQALAPLVYYNGKDELLCPKDPKGGSWVAAKDNGDVVVLLNGAFVKHVVLPWYRKSRGLILLDIISAERPERYYQGLNLDGIEPFTLILYTSGKLYECRWDGGKKWMTAINSRRAHIWSSATLYDKIAAAKHKNWFELWRQFGAQRTTLTIMDFHRYGGHGDPKDSLVIDRDGKMKTMSITNIHVRFEQLTMTYHDIMDDRRYISELQVTRTKGKVKPKECF
ncbi:MAG TPA: NRDE family protein [Mucilaginibacter sp.]|nr:NRDE family protein [Mucilaginibacter sp.]